MMEEGKKINFYRLGLENGGNVCGATGIYHTACRWKV